MPTAKKSAGRKSGASKSRSSGARGSRSTKSRGATSSAARTSSQTTTDHEQIQKWAEARGGKPACVKGTGGKRDTGMIRIDFPGFSGEESLQEISWDEWFEAFDANGLALVYQEQTSDGEESRFNKLVSRERVES